MSKREWRRWTCELVEESFRQYYAVHGRPPKWEDLGTEGLPYSRTVERLYGGRFDRAMLAAGFIPRGVGQPRKHHGVGVAS